MTTDQYYNYATKVDLRDAVDCKSDPEVLYVVHHRLKIDQPVDDDDDDEVEPADCTAVDLDESTWAVNVEHSVYCEMTTSRNNSRQMSEKL